jgi:GntP family gluconate:H+ symporter
MASTGGIICIVLAGVAAVVGGILWLRLNAFLALILGAAIVGVLTPAGTRERHALERHASAVRDVADGSIEIAPRGALFEAETLVWLRPGAGGALEELGRLRVERVLEERDARGRPRRAAAAAMLHNPRQLSPGPGDLAVPAREHEAALRAARQSLGERIGRGFGETCLEIGILVALAAIVGACLLESGGADRIVRSALKLFGEGGAPLAFLWSGYLLGIPVFFDTVFYLMIPLGKAMALRTGRRYLLYVLTIIAGATMTHSLVPPTPGPLFVSERLGIELGTMVIAGCIVGAVTAAYGLLHAVWAERRWDLPLRPSAELPMEKLRAIAQRDERELPSLTVSLLPILLPVALISFQAIVRSSGASIPGALQGALDVLGHKNIAMAIGAVIAMAALAYQRRGRRGEVAGVVGGALSSAGVVILITAAGGAFGSALQSSGIAQLLTEMPLGSPALVLSAAFLVTAAIRTAQGSATVAMVTSAGLFAALAESDALGFHPVYLALAIGCGSKPIHWMNDSGFWVITTMGGLTEKETLKYVTPMTAGMGVVGFAATVGGAMLFPLV